VHAIACIEDIEDLNQRSSRVFHEAQCNHNTATGTVGPTKHYTCVL